VAREGAAVRRVVVVASASGNGKTTFARALATALEAPCHELDALNHRAGWVEAPADELRAAVEQLVAGDAWVMDGSYRGKLGSLVLDAADVVVWLDLPVRVWLPRLLQRTTRRIVTREELWNGNRESLRSALGGRDALVPFALRSHYRRRRTYPTALAPYPVVRLRTRRAVDAFLERVLTKASRAPE
jgi:adenylate kinase family enzyme